MVARVKKHERCEVLPTLKKLSTTDARFGHPPSQNTFKNNGGWGKPRGPNSK